MLEEKRNNRSKVKRKKRFKRIVNLVLPICMYQQYRKKGMFLARNTQMFMFLRMNIITPQNRHLTFRTPKVRRRVVDSRGWNSSNPHLIFKCEGLEGNYFAPFIALSIRPPLDKIPRAKNISTDTSITVLEPSSDYCIIMRLTIRNLRLWHIQRSSIFYVWKIARSLFLLHIYREWRHFK